MKYRSKALRKGAIDALLQADGGVRKAQHLFNSKFPSHGLSRPDKFIQYWARAWEDRQSMDSLAKSGRPPAMSDSQARQCALLFKLGSNIGGQRRHYTCIEDALESSPAFRSALAAKPVSHRTLRKSMRQVDPGIVRRVESVKPALGAKLKKERRATSAFMRKQKNDYFRRIHWLDMKQMYIAPKKRIVWTDAAWGAPTIEDHRVALSSGKLVRLKFYASVCYATGAACIKFVTGTSPKAVKIKAYQVCLSALSFLVLVHAPCAEWCMLLLHVPWTGCREHPEFCCRSFQASLQGCLNELLVLLCVIIVQPQES